MSFGIPSDEIKATLAKTDKVMDEALIVLRQLHVLLQEAQAMLDAIRLKG